MKKQKLIIVTGNKMKFESLSRFMSSYFNCEQGNFSEYNEIQGEPDEILKHKMLAAFNEFQAPVLVDDVSVHFDMLNGFPGPYAKDFFGAISQYEVGRRFEGEKIQTVCRLGICFSPDDFVISVGKVSGVIVKALEDEKNANTFDVCVKIDGTNKRMCEMTPEEKDTLTHRGVAMNELIKALESRI